MTESRFVLDTNAVLYLTTEGSNILSDLNDVLDKSELLISVITEIELFAKPELHPKEEESLRTFLSFSIPTIALTNEIKNETIAIRRSSKLKLPDCAVAATAIVLDAVLLTADKKMLNLSWPGLRARQIF